VGGTTPESTGGQVTARTLFDQTDRPFWFVEAARLLDAPEVKALYEGYPGNFGETLIELASLRILGRERPIPLVKWARELKPDVGEGDRPGEVFQDVVALRRIGAIGFRYYEERHHGNHGTAGIEFRGRADVDMAVEVLERSAEALLPALVSLTRYTDWVGAHPFRYITASDRLGEE